MSTWGFPALAGTWITCGPVNGQAYILPQGLAAQQQFGWQQDGTSSGYTILVRNGDKLDILYKDAIGIHSASANGGKVSILGMDGPNITVGVIYKGASVELYTFDFQDKIMVRSVHKYGAAINKAGTYKASCR